MTLHRRLPFLTAVLLLSLTACHSQPEGSVPLTAVQDREITLNALGIPGESVALATLDDQPGPSSVGGTCHEECRYRCNDLYPDDPYYRDLCTFSCIDSDCGGGPFP